jgi:hypothetical protein
VFVIGNTGWTLERDHAITEDGVETIWRLSWDNQLTVLMNSNQMKALAARLVLEANDVDPEWDR